MKYRVFVLVVLAAASPALAANNPYGVHMLDGGSTIQNWARSLTGPGGYCKQLFMGITNGTSGPSGGWVDYVQGCYNRDMIPVCRLATNYGGGQWTAPVPDSPGDYSSFAQAIKRVVQGLPRDNDYPLYIELLNEVNSPKEWGGSASAWEYAHCLVDCAAAIRSIGDSRIRIMNAGLAGGTGFIDDMFTQVPESLWAFDVYAVHCYSLNRPPQFNQHDGTAAPGEIVIDAYLDDLAIIESHGRTGVQVMITETGYALGDQTFGDYPIVNEDNRADYVVRAFRDYWSKWPEVLAVTPFEFLGSGWSNFDWVYADSGTGYAGRPTHAHKQYYDVWNLAKPNMTRGAVNGTVREAQYGQSLAGAVVTLNPGNYTTTTDAMGNYYFPNENNLDLLDPGTYSLSATKTGFAAQTIPGVVVTAAENSVVDFSLAASGTGSVTGVVRDPFTREGMPGVTVTMEPGGASDTSDEDGGYLIQGLAPSIYDVSAEKTGYHDFTHVDLTIAPDETAVLDFCLGPGYDPANPNMLQNTDMEYGGGASGDGVASGWANFTNSPSPSNFAIDTNVKFSGRASQRITPSGSAYDWVGQWTGYGTIFPFQRYKFQAWCKTDSPSGGGARVVATLSQFGEWAVASVVGEPILTTDSGWTLLQGYGVIPDLYGGGASGRLRLELYGAKYGTTWFDRAYVCLDDRTDDPVSPPSSFSAMPQQGEVFLNWKNPASPPYPVNGTVIMCRTDRYPLTPTDGTVVADVAGTPNTYSSCTHSGLQAGVKYYYAAFAHTSGPSDFSDPSFASGSAYDATPPTTPVVVDDGLYTRSQTTLHASWVSSDPESGITQYEYAVGSSPGSTDVVSWTSAGLATEVTRCDLDLANGQVYYIQVRATNGVDLTSTGVSNGITAAASAETIGQAKDFVDGTFVWLENKIVSAGFDAFADEIYIQESDRSAGIPVALSSGSVVTGDVVEVAGTLAGSAVERFITSSAVVDHGVGDAPDALAVTPRSLWCVDGCASDLTQGLLVRTYGRVTEVGADYFVLDGGWSSNSLKVLSASYDTPAVDDFVAVTAVAAAESGDPCAVPVLKLRKSSDWRAF